MIEPKKLAIVGGGPRGLAALESIYCSLVAKGIPNILKTQLFEARQLPGAGLVYDISQPDTNWLNFSQRALTLAKRDRVKCEFLVIPEFPSYHDWSGYIESKDSCLLPDTFPLRSTLGKYLNERFESIAYVLKKAQLLEVILIEVMETEWNNENFRIIAKDGTVYNADELVLTIGHQPTKHSEQMVQWIAYNRENSSVDLFTDPYPVERVLSSDVLTPGSVVALRGFGLAMIDMMRALTIGLGGKFRTTDASTKELTYVKSGREPFRRDN
ncbi:hypothetical protein LCGC14_1290470 [marine sediment metagenome]|uniref:FAD-dependent urate hydroxylase HpyO/Asp monooxygenase CreE-like FAD/NAD(P)-binding domain-containing protein n=1 Tax=marine sediment metagenome TaxID=412755 RepID=A0A0F9KUA4_9ZZZZ